MPIDRRTLIQRSCLTAASFAAFPRWAAAGLFRQRPDAPRPTPTRSSSSSR